MATVLPHVRREKFYMRDSYTGLIGQTQGGLRSRNKAAVVMSVISYHAQSACRVAPGTNCFRAVNRQIPPLFSAGLYRRGDPASATGFGAFRATTSTRGRCAARNRAKDARATLGLPGCASGFPSGQAEQTRLRTDSSDTAARFAAALPIPARGRRPARPPGYGAGYGRA